MSSETLENLENGVTKLLDELMKRQFTTNCRNFVEVQVTAN